MSGEKSQGVQQIGKKGDKIYVLSQRVHEHSCRAERGSGRDARTRRIVIGWNCKGHESASIDGLAVAGP